MENCIKRKKNNRINSFLSGFFDPFDLGGEFRIKKNITQFKDTATSLKEYRKNIWKFVNERPKRQKSRV